MEVVTVPGVVASNCSNRAWILRLFAADSNRRYSPIPLKVKLRLSID